MSQHSTPEADPEAGGLRGRELAASLTVNEIEKSLAWYQDVLGFQVAQRHEREGRLVAVSLRAGQVRILIGQDDGAKGWDREKGAGFSLMITTGQDIDALARRIVERGGSLELEPMDMPWGARVFRIVDPDGFRFSVSSPRPST